MHERISVNGLCFMGEPFRDLAEHWRALKPNRVGFTTNLLFDESLEAAQAACDGYTVEVFSHQFMAGDLSPDKTTWEEPRARLSKVIEYAGIMGAKQIYMVTGGHGQLAWEEAAEIFAAAVKPCIPIAKSAGVNLLVETSPPLYAHSHIAHTLRDTVILAEMTGIGVCIDIFPIWTEGGLRETIQRAQPILHLVQVGDWVLGDRSYPSRAVPGDGMVPLKRICGWILEGGYKGAFDLELLGPRLDKEGRRAATGRAADYMTNLLNELGA